MYYRQFIFVFLGISSVIILLIVLNYAYPIRASLYPHIPDPLKKLYLQNFPRTNTVDYPEPDGPGPDPIFSTPGFVKNPATPTLSASPTSIPFKYPEVSRPSDMSLLVDYKISKLSENSRSPQYRDYVISGIDSYGKEYVLVPSVRSRIDRSLWKLSFPKGSDILYFHVVLEDTDAPPGEVWSYDVTKDLFTKMTVSSYYKGYGPKQLTSGGNQIVVVTYDRNLDPKGQTMFLIDLPSDSVKTIVELNDPETFRSKCNDCMIGEQSEITLTDPNTIIGKVYNINTNSFIRDLVIKILN